MIRTTWPAFYVDDHSGPPRLDRAPASVETHEMGRNPTGAYDT